MCIYVSISLLSRIPLMVDCHLASRDSVRVVKLGIECKGGNRAWGNSITIKYIPSGWMDRNVSYVNISTSILKTQKK